MIDHVSLGTHDLARASNCCSRAVLRPIGLNQTARDSGIEVVFHWVTRPICWRGAVNSVAICSEPPLLTFVRIPERVSRGT